MEKLDELIQSVANASKSTKITIIVAAIVILILFIVLLQYFSKAKCPKCKSRKNKEISSKLLSTDRKRRSRTVDGREETYYVDVNTFDITYECAKCKNVFTKRRKVTMDN